MKRASRARPLAKRENRRQTEKKSARYSLGEKEEQNARECIGQILHSDFITLCAINDHSLRDSPTMFDNKWNVSNIHVYEPVRSSSSGNEQRTARIFSRMEGGEGISFLETKVTI